MEVFGIDISHHQDERLDLARAKREGIEFVFIKSTEGSTFVDSAFVGNLAEARSAGLLVAAYHYVKGNVTSLAQVQNVLRVVPKDVPVIPDIEAGSGGVTLARDIVNGLRNAGYHVPMVYLPRWYWQSLGSPSLAGLPPLWSSRYPDNVVGSITDEWADVPSTYWAGYGGIEVAVLQFTSSAAIAGFQPIDANAYRGTRAGLQALLTGTVVPDPPAPIVTTIQEEDHVKTYFVKGNGTAAMPAPHSNVKAGDLVFMVEATTEGMTRRHIQADELAAAGVTPTTVTHAWLDKIPGADGESVELWPWENAGGGPVPGEPAKKEG